MFLTSFTGLAFDSRDKSRAIPIMVVRQYALARLSQWLSAWRSYLVISWSKHGNITWSWMILGVQLEQVKRNSIRLGTLTVHRRNERCSKPHCNGYPRAFGWKAKRSHEEPGPDSSRCRAYACRERSFTQQSRTTSIEGMKGGRGVQFGGQSYQYHEKPRQ